MTTAVKILFIAHFLSAPGQSDDRAAYRGVEIGLQSAGAFGYADMNRRA